VTAEQVAARVAEQQAILAEGARYVAPGGTLVYITCSIFDEENSRQAEQFLAAHPDFHAVPMAPLVEALAPGAGERIHPQNQGILLTPLRTGTDGFYIFLARRR
jgi:16S rRNA (cytosine967-C5)-methyltransferase